MVLPIVDGEHRDGAVAPQVFPDSAQRETHRRGHPGMGTEERGLPPEVGPDRLWGLCVHPLGAFTPLDEALGTVTADRPAVTRRGCHLAQRGRHRPRLGRVDLRSIPRRHPSRSKYPPTAPVPLIAILIGGSPHTTTSRWYDIVWCSPTRSCQSVSNVASNRIRTAAIGRYKPALGRCYWRLSCGSRSDPAGTVRAVNSFWRVIHVPERRATRAPSSFVMSHTTSQIVRPL